ncbi:hypothetical protein CRYUN_Cryun08bG0061300 [Craigia yunnanensis]
MKTELASYGIVINTFEEMEPEYVKEYRKARGNKVWCIGPVSLCNKDALDKAQRGKKASVDEHQCLGWLDSQKPGSVIYACLGSQSNDGFEERAKGRSLVIRGWAPQVLILSHPAIGTLVTHCGWNSTVEGISAGVPLITWPLFADQFANEKLVVQILKIGVKVGVEEPLMWVEEEKTRVLVKEENVEEAIERLINGEGKGRRKRAKKLREMTKKAVDMGGSSHLNITQLIQHIMQRAYDRKAT